MIDNLFQLHQQFRSPRQQVGLQNTHTQQIDHIQPGSKRKRKLSNSK
jgi:hypothetical protein